MPKVSVVIDGSQPVESVVSSIQALDRQTFPFAEVEIVVGAGSQADTRAALDRVAVRRSNVRVVPDADVQEALRGDYVVQVVAERPLFPEALERLVTFADEHGLDVVAGRVADRSRAPAAVFRADAAEIDGHDREQALGRGVGSGVVLAARRCVRVESGRVELDGAEARVGVLASYPSALGAAGADGAGVAAGPVTVSGVRWVGADLVIALSGTDVSDQPPVVQLRRLGDGLSFWLPATVSDAEAEPAVIEVRCSPLSAGADTSLGVGLWELDVAAPGSEGAAYGIVQGRVSSAAVLDGLGLVVAGRRGAPVRLDVGPTRHALLGPLAGAGATVVESARGSLLRVPLPSLHVGTNRPIAGFIGLDALKLPATIEVEEESAVLSAWVSGLAGTSALSAQFGSAPMQPIGLSLSISGIGAMSVIPTPAPPKPKSAPVAAKKAPARTAARKKRSRPKPKGVVAKLRRAVPAPLEPAVRGLRRNPLARRIYRKLTRS